MRNRAGEDEHRPAASKRRRIYHNLEPEPVDIVRFPRHLQRGKMPIVDHTPRLDRLKALTYPEMVDFSKSFRRLSVEKEPRAVAESPKSTVTACAKQQLQPKEDTRSPEGSEYTYTSDSEEDNPVCKPSIPLTTKPKSPPEPAQSVPTPARISNVNETKRSYPAPKTSVDLRLQPPRTKAKRISDMSWLYTRADELRVMDSMHTTLVKWVKTVRNWSPDPLEGLKGKSNGGILAGTKSTDPYPRIKDEEYKYNGTTDFYNRPHGSGTVYFENGDVFKGQFRDGGRVGPGALKCSSTTRERTGISLLEGNYVNDRLEGKGRLEYANGDILHAWFTQGTLHGLGKLFDKERNIKHIGWYANGKLNGLVWQFLAGGGCLVGEVDLLGNLIGDNIAFLFPDLQTVLLGVWVKTEMKMAQTCFIQLVALRNELCQVKFTQPRGPFFSNDGGTRDSICREPLLPDPYESQYVYIRQSKIKGAKEGVFTRKDVPKEFILCFYNGVRLRSTELSDDDKDDWEANAYKIVDLRGRDPADGSEGVLDIPAECVSVRAYCASSAHKANHSFQPNAKFVLFDHPRFGPVPAIESVAEIPKDSEVLVSYDYAMDEAPPWYQELFTQRIIDTYRESKNWNF